MNGSRILFLEDDILYQETIKDFLQEEQFIVDTCIDGQEFLNKTFNNIYDLYIIDLNTPQISGLDIMKMLKEYKDRTMKLVLSSFPEKVLESFHCGCDDFINKNKDVDEVLLRIQVLLKRAYNTHFNSILITDDIEYDLLHKKLYKDHKEIIDLEIHTLLILDYLMKRRGEFVSSFELETNIYPCNTDSKSSAVRYHIWNLRHILGKGIIESRKSFGYRLKSPEK
jgi:DNA-binding response OmpR family regulator